MSYRPSKCIKINLKCSSDEKPLQNYTGIPKRVHALCISKAQAPLGLLGWWLAVVSAPVDCSVGFSAAPRRSGLAGSSVTLARVFRSGRSLKLVFAMKSVTLSQNVCHARYGDPVDIFSCNFFFPSSRMFSTEKKVSEFSLF